MIKTCIIRLLSPLTAVSAEEQTEEGLPPHSISNLNCELRYYRKKTYVRFDPDGRFSFCATNIAASCC